MRNISKLSMLIASQLTNSGYAVTFKDDSILGLAAGRLHEVLASSDATSLEDAAIETDLIIEENKPNPFGDDEFAVGDAYAVATEAIVKDISPIVKNLIDHIRNNAVPTVNAIFDAAFNQTAENITTGGVRLRIENNTSANQLWANPVLLEMVERLYPMATEVNATVGFEHPPCTPELAAAIIDAYPFVSMIPTTQAGADLTNSVIVVYNVVMCTGHQVRSPVAVDPLGAAIIALACVAYTELNIPEGISGKTDDPHVYRVALRDAAAHYAAVVKQCIGKHGIAKTLERVIVSLPEPNREFSETEAIIVDEINYNAYIEDGGSPDAIYGAYVKGVHRNDMSMAYLKANQEALEKHWARHVAFLQSSQRDDFKRVFSRALISEMAKYAQETGKSYNAKDVVEDIYRTDMVVTTDTAYRFARKFIVEAFFDEESDDILSILKEIDHVAENVKGVEFDTAVDIGITGWLVNWAVDQLEFKRL